MSERYPKTGLETASLQYRAGQYSEALASCDRYLVCCPDDAVAYQLRGEILVALARVEEAIVAYETAIELASQRPEPYAYLGELFDRLGERENALKLYRRAVELRPNWQPLRYNLARLYLQQGQYLTARQHYEAALALDSRDAKSYNDLGAIYERWGHRDRARQYYEIAISLAPTRLQPRRNLASLLIEKNCLNLARQTIESTLNLDSQNADLYALLGQCDRRANQLESALANVLRATQLAPDCPSFHEDLGKLFDRLQQPAAALTCFQRAIELDPNQIERYGYCAQMAIRLQQSDLAVTYFRKILTALFESEVCRSWMEDLLKRPQHPSSDVYDRALSARRDFLKTHDRSATLEDSRRSLARLYQHWGDVRLAYEAYDEAEAYYKAAIAVDFKNLQAQQGLGVARSSRERQQEQQKTSLSPFIPDKIVAKARFWLDRHSNARYHLIREGDRGHYESPEFHHSCLGLNCQPCLNRIQETFAPIGLSDTHYRCLSSPALPQLDSDELTAEIPNGRIWVMAQTSWWQVCEAIAAIAPDNTLIADLSREYPGELPGCPQAHHNRHRHRIFHQTQLPPPTQIQGKIAVLCGLSANVYFHWIIDILPRLDILRRSGFSEEDIDGFYVNSINKPFQQETLELLGIPLDRVIESDRFPHIQASQLVVPSFASDLGWATPQTIEFLRSQFLPLLSKSHSTSSLFSSLISSSLERIYISRRSARYRRVINEPELIEMLEKQKFTPIFLEDYPFLEQVRLFSEARVVIAPHGAGLTNLVFCQPTTTVIELFSPNYIRYYYWSICCYLKLDFHYFIGESLPCAAFRKLFYPDPLTEDFWVNISDFQKLLNFAI